MLRIVNTLTSHIQSVVPAPRSTADVPNFASLFNQATVAAAIQAKSDRTSDPAMLAANLAQSLGLALHRQGIAVPPALRMEFNAKGLILRDDPRNTAFQTVLNGHPELRSQIDELVAVARTDRATAFASASQDFLQHAKDPRRASAVLENYTQRHPTPSLAAAFDGTAMSVQEKGADGWRSVKTEREFSWELTIAYQQYAANDETLFESLMQAVSSKTGATQPNQQPRTGVEGEEPAAGKTNSQDTAQPTTETWSSTIVPT
ncbi:hypothetical protein ACUHMQ_19590 [Chitinimonas sp. PSY-7]|uniref:hypothetical protein n=1 Tax=Chitinimonas sp. PSY-7 TaxID=3459088 RepID=UPI00404033BB